MRRCWRTLGRTHIYLRIEMRERPNYAGIRLTFKFLSSSAQAIPRKSNNKIITATAVSTCYNTRKAFLKIPSSTILSPWSINLNTGENLSIHLDHCFAGRGGWECEGGSLRVMDIGSYACSRQIHFESPAFFLTRIRIESRDLLLHRRFRKRTVKEKRNAIRETIYELSKQEKEKMEQKPDTTQDVK